MRTVTSYLADDGTNFDTREACEAHEASSFTRQFVGLTLDQVEAALSRTDVKLADAFEVIGGRIAETRRQRGEKRRRVRLQPEAPSASDTPSLLPGVTDPQPQPEKSRSPAFEKGRKAFLAGKPETIPGGLPESEWDDWAEGYARQSGRADALGDIADAADKAKETA